MPDEARTAIVVVHGMGEQRPLETLNSFVHTALKRIGGERLYYSRPARITNSFEARRILAFERDWPENASADSSNPAQGQTEIFEYHWSFLMTGNKLGDLFTTSRRLLFRLPQHVPDGLRALWAIAWAILACIVAVVVYLFVTKVTVEEWTVPGVLKALAINGFAITLSTYALGLLSSFVISHFVDVVRYLDTAPRSYEARRAIRGGLVALLRAIQDEGRYSRVIVVAHSLGGYIAYDAVTALWAEVSRLHAGPYQRDGDATPLQGLNELQDAAEGLLAKRPPPPRYDDTGKQLPIETPLQHFQRMQFDLWQGLRRQGNPWLITDLITVGTPMYFAHLLLTSSKKEFDRLVRRSELPLCPPRSKSETVEGEADQTLQYGWNNRTREVLVPGAPFAVVRWTNLWFPPRFGIFGDWFGGALKPLFGEGIRDVPIEGDRAFWRYFPAYSHTKYFTFADSGDDNGIAAQIRAALSLHTHQELEALQSAPPVDPDSARL